MLRSSTKNRLFVSGLVAAGLVAASGMGMAALPGAAFAQTSACVAAGATGLTTAKVAHSGETVTGAIDATGCDIGLYVGPGTSHVTVNGVTITGATNHALLIENASAITVENSTIINNGTNPETCPGGGAPSKTPCISENKPLELVGTTKSVIKDNLVADNHSDGGIGIADNGKIDPGALKAGIPAASVGNLVEGNTVVNNSGGCGIVVAAYNPHAGVKHNRVIGNTVVGNVAGVVIAADSPATVADANAVLDNTITGNFLPGVIVHANTPGDVVAATVIKGNVLSGNGGDKSADGGQGPKGKTAIVIAAEPRPQGFPAGLPDAVVKGTAVKDNTIGGETTALFSANATATILGVNVIASDEAILGI